MIKNSKKIIFGLLLSILLIPAISSAQFALPTANEVGAPNVEMSIPLIIANITNWIFTFVGILAVLLVLFAGLMYMTSAGDEQRMMSARKILIYAIIGLIISVLAVVIVRNVVGIM